MLYNENLEMSETDFNQRRDIIKHEAYAIVDFLMRHSVGIVVTGQDDTVVSQGSGTCVSIGERFFIATAAHVLKGFEDDDLWIVHSMEPTGVRPPILCTGIQGGSEFEPVDVAWIELDTDTAATSGKTFVTLNQIRAGVNQVNDDLIALNGYPGSFTIEYGTKVVSAQSMSFIGGTIALSAWPSFDDYNCLPEDYFILAAYPPEGNYLISGQPYKVPDPHGMSGGGLWQIPANSEGIWSMNLSRLVGINVEWNQEGQWVSANQMQHWLRLVAEDFPDLKGQIEQYLVSSC